MARPLRIQFPGAIYHVTSRGNARQDIVADDRDRQAYFAVLARVVERYNWLCHAYCLMDNHYHLLVETPEGNLAYGMRQLNGLYTQRFNRRHGRVGHLFQGRYGAILVERESYLLELCRYVVLNPLRAGMVATPETYRWSSYRATTGAQSAPDFLTTAWILEQFGGPQARQHYQDFVREGIRAPSPWNDIKGQVALGGKSFIRSLQPYLKDVEAQREVPRRDRLIGRPGLERLFSETGTKAQRNHRIAEAHLHHGYSLSEIARHLGLHPSSVSKIVAAENSQFKT
jgi:REP element-mobilizing transposase RayT